MLRWQLEVTFQEVRTHLGVETQRQWSDLAIARTTPILLDLFSWTTLATHVLQNRSPMTQRTAAWYDKPSPTFVDAIALVRRRLWLASEGFFTVGRRPRYAGTPRRSVPPTCRLPRLRRLKCVKSSLWDYMSMSLRDIDHCVRLLALLSRNLKPGKRVYPTLAGLYITLKFKNPDLYQRMVDRSCSAAEIMDYIESEVREKSQRLYRPISDLDHCLEPIEVWLCCVLDTAASEQLTQLSEGADVDTLARLPERTKRRGRKGAAHLMQQYQRESALRISTQYDPTALAELPALIDLYYEMIH